MSALVTRALAEAGLAAVLDARAASPSSPSRDALEAFRPRLEAADLLVLGALADRIRAVEVGDAVRVYADVAPAPDGDGATDAGPVVEVALVAGDGGPRAADTGLGFLRRVALARILGPRAARVRVDWSGSGSELAQVALGFGASELVGSITTKRGLPIADGATSGSGKRSARKAMALVKRQELAGYVRRCGRRPLFASDGGGFVEWGTDDEAAARAAGETTTSDTGESL